jgi:hypothetical protein
MKVLRCFCDLSHCSRSGCPQSSAPWYDLSVTSDYVVGLVP